MRSLVLIAKYIVAFLNCNCMRFRKIIYLRLKINNSIYTLYVIKGYPESVRIYNSKNNAAEQNNVKKV